MAQKRCTVSMDFDHLSAEGIFAVGHSCGPQGIGDQDHAFCSEHGEGGTDHAAVDMDSVADDLGHDLLIIKGRSNDCRLPVVKGRHAVIKMGGMICSRRKGCAGGFVIGNCMANGNMDPFLSRSLDEFHGTRLFRSQSHQLHKTSGVCLESF